MPLSDVRMPGMNGIDLLRVLHERAPGVDVIRMTAHDDLQLRHWRGDRLATPSDQGAVQGGTVANTGATLTSVARGHMDGTPRMKVTTPSTGDRISPVARPQ